MQEAFQAAGCRLQQGRRQAGGSAGGVAARVAAAFSAFVESCIIALLYNYSFSFARQDIPCISEV